MLQLEPHNRYLATTLPLLFASPKPSAVDQAFVDFDAVRYHLSTPDPKQKTVLLLSMDVRCWADLTQHGADAVMQREYSQFLLPPAETEAEYSVSLRIDIAALPESQDERDEIVSKLSLLKRNALAAPFEKAFGIQKHLEANPRGEDDVVRKEDVMSIHYRPDEALYILPSSDRVTIVFSTVFKEETDRIFGKVFLQEFVDARRRPSCQTAPQVLYTNREPPLEIRDIPGLGAGLERGENVGYVTFVLFPRHFSTPDLASSSITQMQLFRDYLHYHIKCSKAYMHSRMRTRVAEFLKVLNRAKPDVAAGEGARKTASGRSFVRA